MSVSVVPRIAGVPAAENSMLARAASRWASKGRRGLSRLIAAGDSYPVGTGASVLANAFYYKLKTKYTGKLLSGNYGNAGKPIASYTSGTLQDGDTNYFPSNAGKLQIATDDITFCIMGLNDLRGNGVNGNLSTNGCGPYPDNFSQMRSRAIAMATHFLVPETAKTRFLKADQSALNPNLTFTGTWTIGFSALQNVAYTNAGGSVSGTTAKGDLMIIRLERESSSGATITVVIDGVTYPSIPVKSVFDTWAQDCVIIPNLPNTTHSFTLTHAGGTSNLMGESVDCIDTTQSDFSATFIYSPPGYLNDGSNIGWGNTGNTVNSASANSVVAPASWLYGNGAVDRFAVALDDAMNYLFNLGFNVIKADKRIGFNPNTMLSGDTVHMNDTGHDHDFRNFDGPISVLLR